MEQTPNADVIIFKRFDQVRLRTTKNVSYLSSTEKVTPEGVWQVAAAIGTELLLVRNTTVLKIPATDVLKVVEYDISQIIQHFGRLSSYGKDRKEDSNTKKS